MGPPGIQAPPERKDEDIPGYADMEGNGAFTPLPYPLPESTPLRTCAINVPLDGYPQVLVAGRQIWKRRTDSSGQPPVPAAFDTPEDLRHLIEFSEPWLDLNATGVSAEGFIVGIGKKVTGDPHGVTASDADVAKYTAAGLTITAKDWKGKPAYGPVSPEMCGLWDHDPSHYEAHDDQPKQYEEHAFMLVPIALRTDADRNGAIKGDGSDTLGSGVPWRFWINDDSDDGDFRGEKDLFLIRNGSHDDVPGSGKNAGDSEMHIHGRADLEDWFPVHIDGKQLLDANEAIPGNPMKLVFSHAEQALHATYGAMDHADLTPFQTTDGDATFGLTLDKYKYTANTLKLPATPEVGAPAPLKLVTAIRADRGHIVVDGIKETYAPLRLSIMGTKNDGTPAKLATVRLPLSLTTLYKPGEPNRFFRWVNLRKESGGEVANVTDLSEPINWPDSGTNKKNTVFVHGYYTSERLALSSVEFFKRSWWSGSRSMMTLVTWFGDPASDGSTYVSGSMPSDYYEAVRRAFRVAPDVASSINALPGTTKDIVAHSLGNMVASSAIVYHGLSVDKYVMLDPAVACEAYDDPLPETDSSEGYMRRSRSDEMGSDSSFIQGMVEPNWTDFSTQRRTFASEFHTLFPTSDDRARLT